MLPQTVAMIAQHTTQSSPIDTTQCHSSNQTQRSPGSYQYLGHTHPWSWLSHFTARTDFQSNNTARGPSIIQHHYSVVPIQNTRNHNGKYTVDTQILDLFQCHTKSFIHSLLSTLFIRSPVLILEPIRATHSCSQNTPFLQSLAMLQPKTSSSDTTL